ncbi:M23 family metallopeptidase [Rubrivirga sp. IMCC45206]|uniref:M23 family metallopeptidase n=1 Tax=Rubrivirga sp. IMCC45206 TaxID=3391614 RepID=UPI003990281C
MLRLLALAPLVLALSCDTLRVSPPSRADGCDVAYPSADATPYVVPFAPGTRVTTGLANCSSSFHGEGEPDALATDFDLPTGTPFVAARAGRVAFLDEDEPSTGGGSGNYVFVDHGDRTGAYYLHSPAGGIAVEVGDEVARGDTLGVVGRSGLAGYPHLHFIVVEGDPSYPYRGVPVTFSNASPAHAPLRTRTTYEVLP